MKNAELQRAVDDFMAAIPKVIIGARSRSGGACAFCSNPRGVQHTEDCPLWGLIDARILYRVASEGPKPADPARTEVMQALEGADLNLTATDAAARRRAAVGDNWWLT